MGFSDAFKGGAGGALAGGAIGGPLGAGIGGVVGGLAGYFGGQERNPYEERLSGFANRAGGMQAPQRGAAAQGAYSSFRGNQADFIKMLEAQARGEGPSLAGEQLKAATDRNQRQAQSLAAGAQGPNAALAQFQAQAQGGQMAQQAAQDAAQARIAEIYNAQQQLGINIHGARGADEGMNQFNASAQNQQMDANLQAKLQTLGIKTEAELQALMAAGGLAGQPGLGDQILAGGAGMFGFAAGQKGNQPQGGSGGGAKGWGPNTGGWGPMGAGYLGGPGYEFGGTDNQGANPIFGGGPPGSGFQPPASNQPGMAWLPGVGYVPNQGGS